MMLVWLPNGINRIQNFIADEIRDQEMREKEKRPSAFAAGYKIQFVIPSLFEVSSGKKQS
jgi:hypothetical protein